MAEIGSVEELRELLGEPDARAAGKVRSSLHEHDKEWLAHSPFCVISTAGGNGWCDASPKGDPPGFVRVLDDTTIAIPERPGNRRADGYLNILANPRVGLLFLIPGRADTLRINGRARLVKDAPFFDTMVVKGHRPRLALVVEAEEVFFHCAKSLLRSALWKPETWDPQAVASPARIAKSLIRKDQTLEELEAYYGDGYEAKVYRG
ncbi:pyridoxamine 5'-phosphate oxidase family protein [Streptomyces sp. TRM66268-LWL]|uniref:Pyridoxamine 5'-phosphate oxidase family protein n=1 Tax=Streptomyces polyasparticus TaxID=2767826 RepID=A0ABR7SDL0_9ACTN|nr:pyridoxamine 5'-phosphate oxidase family protein [Streptomyces polyasparticus]MBC9713585.1 pyridoxamine 5'-phosphate oxidase family protein [Streptomyces polyasparticus]